MHKAMNDTTAKSTLTSFRDRYRWILRKTIRSELEEQLWKHLLEDENLDAYLDCLHLSKTVSAVNGLIAVEAAKSAIEQCNLITEWFRIDDKFWDEQRNAFRDQLGEQLGLTAYREVLARLIVNLHGFWVFTLDDTNHTFRFVRAPADRDEWGAELGSNNATKESENSFRPAIHFGDHVYYKSSRKEHSDDLKIILESSLEEYLLRPGEGSVGLGLRADRGVCLRDTVRDLRGAVGLEDCITRNLSYIGLPIFPREAGNQSELGARGRPIGHFGIFFPAPVGWHASQGSRAEWCEHCMFPCVGEKEHDSICLFQKMLNLRQRIVQPLVAQNYQTLSDDRFKVRVAQIAGLGDDPDFQNRGVEPSKKRELFLKKVIPDKDAEQDSERRREETLDIEDFQAAQIWERHAAIAGLSEGSISMSESATTWRQSARWKYPDLFFASLRQQLINLTADEGAAGTWSIEGPWQSLYANDFVLHLEPLGAIGTKQSILIVQKPGAASATNGESLRLAREFWKAAQAFIKDSSPPESLSEFHQPSCSESESTLTDKFGGLVRTLKWKRLLRSHAAQCLASCFLPLGPKKKDAVWPRRLSTFLFPDANVHSDLESRLKKINALPDALSVSVLGGADFRLDPESIKTSDLLSPLKPRLRYELTEAGHTLPVFLSLAYAASKGGMLRSATSPFASNHSPESRSVKDWNIQRKDWPIQSEAYACNDQERHIDCGTETAFSIPAIWQSWCKEFAPDAPALAEIGCLDRIDLAHEGDSIRINLSSSAAGTDNAHLSFLLVDNTADCKAFHRALAHDTYGLAKFLMEKESPLQPQGPRCDTSNVSDTSETPDTNESPIWRRREDGTVPEECNDAEKVLDFLTFCRKRLPSRTEKTAEATSFCLLLAFVGGEWMLELRSWTADGKEYPPESGADLCWEYSSVGLAALIEAFQRVARAKGARFPLGPEFGLTTHVFVPVRRPIENTSTTQDVGFALFSGSQVEHDTIRRVEIRSAQKALLTFATDYLEYAIAQELANHELTQSLQGFAHASRRMARYLRVGAMAPQRRSIYEMMSRLLGKPNRGNLPNTFQQIYREKPWPDDIVTQIREYIQGTAEIEQIGILKFTHAILITALTYVLAHKIEPPLPLQAGSIPDQAKSFEIWLLHILQSSIKAEQDDNPNARFELKADDQPEPDKQHEYFPAGSVCLVLQELIRNATKYGESDTLRKVTLAYTHPGYVVVSLSNVVTSSQVIDSTQSGFETIANALAVNFGPTERGGWSLIRPREKPQPGTEYKVILSLDVNAYKARCSKKP